MYKSIFFSTEKNVYFLSYRNNNEGIQFYEKFRCNFHAMFHYFRPFLTLFLCLTMIFMPFMSAL